MYKIDTIGSIITLRHHFQFNQKHLKVVNFIWKNGTILWASEAVSVVPRLRFLSLWPLTLASRSVSRQSSEGQDLFLQRFDSAKSNQLRGEQ